MTNRTLTVNEQRQNQVIFWLSLFPLCFNSIVSYIIFRPTNTATRELRSPSFQIIGFFTLSSLLSAFIWLTIPCGLWAFGGSITPELQKIIGTACASFGWYQSLLYLTILAFIQLIAAIEPIGWFSFTLSPNIKSSSIMFGAVCFVVYAIGFGVSYAFDCEFVENDDLVLMLSCGHWLIFAAVAQRIQLILSALFSISATIVCKYRNRQQSDFGIVQKQREWRMILITFTQWVFVALLHAFYQFYMFRQTPESLGTSAYLLYWVYPKYANLAYVCSAAVTYFCLSTELRKATVIL